MEASFSTVYTVAELCLPNVIAGVHYLYVEITQWDVNQPARAAYI